MLYGNEGWTVGVGGVVKEWTTWGGRKTSAVRCNMCDEQERGEEEGQL